MFGLFGLFGLLGGRHTIPHGLEGTSARARPVRPAVRGLGPARLDGNRSSSRAPPRSASGHPHRTAPPRHDGFPDGPQ